MIIFKRNDNLKPYNYYHWIGILAIVQLITNYFNRLRILDII